jgi:signal transduction histidine kinase
VDASSSNLANGRGDRPAPSPDAAFDRLRDAVRRFAADELEHRIEPGLEGPAGDLSADLNRMAENLQRRREELVRAVELYCLRRFGSVLVHDLKNMAARLGFVPQNLRSAGTDPEVVEACAATVQDTAGRLMAVVRRFRDQRDATVLKIRGDVNRTLGDALEHSGVRQAPDIRTEVDLAPLPETSLDAPYLEEAFINLLRNAMEAMPVGGTIRVRSRLRDERQPPQAEIEIADDGPGMTREFIERDLFTPFRSTKPRGMGLGMFSSRETVQLHGGRIDVESRPGAGTTFRITLPIEPEEAG